MLFPQTPAKRLRVMHFADVHLGVETYGKYNAETGLNTRLEDFTKSLNSAIDAALEADIDLAIFAGDAYKARDPNQTHQRAFANCLKRLTDAGLPVVMLVGNHDIPNTRGRAHALEIYGLLGGGDLGTVTIFQSPQAQIIPTRKGEVVVAGMPYLTRSRVLAQDEAKNKTVEEVAFLIRQKYADYIKGMGEECLRDYPEHIALLTGHFTVAEARIGVQNFLLNPNEPQIPLMDVVVSQPSPWDYVAMGHVHKFQDMNRGQQPPIVYCGSIDRIDFGERAEQKGIVLADVSRHHAEFRPVGLTTRPFLQIEVNTNNSDDPTQAILNALRDQPLAGAVVRVTYQVPPDRAALVRTDEIRRALAPAHLLVALSREMPQSEARIRADMLQESLTLENILEKYVDLQPRLAPRKEELMLAARPLIDVLEAEESTQ